MHGVLRLSGKSPVTTHAWGDAPETLRAVWREVPSVLPDRTWAAVLPDRDGRLVALPSSTLTAGLFWTVDHPADGEPMLIIGPSLREVVEARTAPTTLNTDFALRFLWFDADPLDTPYAEVSRIPPGTAARWRTIDQPPDRIDWCTPRTWPEPSLRGDEAISAYLRAFDTAVDDLLDDSPAIASTLSGGLDSSFVVASLLRHATVDRPVHAFCHVPHPDASLRSTGAWDPDDSMAAEAMETAYPGLVRLTRIANFDRVQPLDVAARLSAETWAPARNPGNLVWSQVIAQRATELGATRLFWGENGNSAFSFDHRYAASYYLAHGKPGSVARMVRERIGDGLPAGKALNSSVIRPLLSPVRARLRRTDDYFRSVGLARPRSSVRPGSRQHVLDWMRNLGSVNALAQVPDPLSLDPFTASAVLRVAAAIEPSEWGRGSLPRGLARRLGEGRVPDAIRLRTRRGGQSWDNWYAVHDQRERYLDELLALRTTPVLEGNVDVSALTTEVGTWPWGNPAAPPPALLPTIDRLLAHAAFIRMTSSRLAARS